MVLLQKTRVSIARMIVRRRARSLERNREMKDLSRCKSVLIISSLSEDQDARQTRAFCELMKEQGTEVFVLMYNADFKKNNISQLYDFKLITKDDLNWLFMPSTTWISQLIVREFDLLVDLTMDEFLPLKYCTLLSKARFKAGAAQNYKRNYCDLTIDVGRQKDGAYLIEQLKHYLSIINKTEHVA